MQLEGNFPDPEERASRGLPLSPLPVRDPATEGRLPAVGSAAQGAALSGRGEGRLSHSRAPGAVAVSPASSPSRISVGAGLAPAPLSAASPSTPVVVPLTAAPVPVAVTLVPVAVTPVILSEAKDPLIDEPLPNHATLHSSSPSLPAVAVASSDPSPLSLPAGEGRGEGRPSSAQDPVQDSCTLVQGSLTGVLR